MKPCNDCPFRTNACKGWIGTFDDANDLHRAAHAEVPFSCHQQTEHATDMLSFEAPQCVGRLLYARKNCKRFYNNELNNLMAEAYQESPDLSNILDFLGLRERHAEPMK